MVRNVFSEQVFYGTSAAWCLYRPDTPHPFSAFKRNDDRKVIENWGVSNGHCEHLWPCEQCVYNCEHKQWSVFSCEQRAPRRFSASWNLSLLKRCFAPSNLADTFKNRRAGAKVGNMIRPYRGSTIPSILQPITPCLICHLLQNYYS